MSSKYLNTATAVVTAFGLAVPVAGFAQSQNQRDVFPCIAPDGSEVQNAQQLAKALEDAVLASADLADPAPETACLREAYGDIKGEEIDALKVLLADAPEQIREDYMPLLEAADSAAEADVMETGEATAAPINEEIADADPAAVDKAADSAVAAEIEEATNASEPNDANEGSEAATVNATDAEAPAVVTEDTAATIEATDGDTTVVETETAVEAEVTTETDSEEASTSTDGATGEMAAEADAESGAPTAEAVAEAGAGEADGTQLTDEERQARDAERETGGSDAAAAATSAEGDDADGGATEAEVTTQVVTEEDVRSSSEDFEAPVTGDTTAKAKSSDDDRRSDFERAILLGLGAALVGSVLDNGDEVVSNTGDRIVVERDGELRILKNDDTLLQRPGAEVQTRTFNDGSARTTVTYEDGSQIITVRAADGRVLRRVYIRAEDGAEVVLFDDTQTVDQIDFSDLPTLEELRAADKKAAASDAAELDAALRRSLLADVDRRFSLRQVRDYKRVRALAPTIEIDAVNFATGSAAIEPSQAEALLALGDAMRQVIAEDPGAVFLVEGHTDAVGSASYNLALSDRRAETVALALTEYFKVPPQNLVIQGYGETDLRIPTLEAERANRRALVRNITALLR